MARWKSCVGLGMVKEVGSCFALCVHYLPRNAHPERELSEPIHWDVMASYKGSIKSLANSNQLKLQFFSLRLREG